MLFASPGLEESFYRLDEIFRLICGIA